MDEMQNPVYVYQGSRISVGQKFKLDIETGDSWFELDATLSKILVGHTIVQINHGQLLQLVKSSEFQDHMYETSYRDWYNKRLLDRNPTAPSTVVNNAKTQDTLTDLNGLGALGVRIQRH